MHDISLLKKNIERIAAIQDAPPTPDDRLAIEKVVDLISAGTLTTVVWQNNVPIVNTWIKQAILLYFRIRPNLMMESGLFNYFDKMPVKTWTESDGVRSVPGSIVRHGAFVESGAILMPSFINIGAWVGSGSMIDTWATVGSCAYVGRNVHVSGGVGLGGVLEPVQALPVIVEDDVFLGSRVVAVEGVRIRKGAVIGAGVILTSSTKIIDVTGSSEKIFSGEIPENSVVIPGAVAKSFLAGTYSIPCALIIGKRKESTNKKTSLNEALRDFSVSV